MNNKRSYDRAVKLSCEQSSITELASELGVSADRIYSWRSEFSKYGDSRFTGRGIEGLSDDARKVKAVEKKLKNTELELEILKKNDPCFT